MQALVFGLFMIFAPFTASAQAVSHTSERPCTVKAMNTAWETGPALGGFLWVVNDGLSNQVWPEDPTVPRLAGVSPDTSFTASCDVLTETTPGDYTLGLKVKGLNGEVTPVQYFNFTVLPEPLPVPAQAAQICIEGEVEGVAVNDCETY
jgi:hypothetical protein